MGDEVDWRAVYLYEIEHIFNRIYGKGSLAITLSEEGDLPTEQDKTYGFTETISPGKKRKAFSQLGVTLVRMVAKPPQEQSEWLYRSYRLVFLQYAMKELGENTKESIARLLEQLQKSRLQPKNAVSLIGNHYKKLTPLFYMEQVKYLLKMNKKDEAITWFVLAFFRLGIDFRKCKEAEVKDIATYYWDQFKGSLKEDMLHATASFEKAVVLFKEGLPYPKPQWLASKGMYPITKKDAPLFYNEVDCEECEKRALEDLEEALDAENKLLLSDFVIPNTR